MISWTNVFLVFLGTIFVLNKQEMKNVKVCVSLNVNFQCSLNLNASLTS